MSQNSTIEWTQKTWNPVTGCSKVSQGCKNCYAEVLAKRFWKDRKFTDVQCHPDRLEQPLHWRKPATVFVNSMSDLFHEDVPFEFITRVFATMIHTNHPGSTKHTFQILTKRPARALEFYDKYFRNSPIIPNVWLGVSVEDQKTADERIPLLLQIPAAVRFLSCEPLLGEIDLFKEFDNGKYDKEYDFWIKPLHLINWVICGGESGHGARPMHPDCARKLRDDCKAAGVPFFFKQWGEWCPAEILGGIWTMQNKNKINNKDLPSKFTIWKQNAYFQNPEIISIKLGKKHSGRLLDGVEHNEFPNTK